MTRSTTVEVRTYRGHRLEVRDDGGDGWIVSIYPVAGGALPEAIRNSIPNGLATLLAEAEQRVDWRLNDALNDGPLGI
jgi:hypothetical protein